MTGNCATDKFQIPITDGQLNILVTAGKEGTPFTLSALEIRKISDVPVTTELYISEEIRQSATIIRWIQVLRPVGTDAA